MRLHRRHRVMLVTGAAGFLGRHLVRGPASDDWEIIAPTSASMDITDRRVTLETIGGWEPDVVAHLAYRKDDRRTIVDGSRNVADAATRAGSPLVHISTDVVFGGRPAPYTEADVPDPPTDYGRDKADAERAVQTSAPSAAILRISLLFGTDHPSPFQIDLADGLRAGRSPMTFFTDEFRCPTHADDVARAISTVADRRDLAGVLHVASPERLSRLDFARALARHAGFEQADLPSTTIARSGQVRAGNVVLDTTRAASLGITCRPATQTLEPGA